MFYYGETRGTIITDDGPDRKHPVCILYSVRGESREEYNKNPSRAAIT